MGGYWSAYWFGGFIYGTEIARGLDVLALVPSDHLTENEIAAAALRDPDAVVNAQTQRRYVWPTEPVVARAYLDQLLRSSVISSAQAETLTRALDRAAELLVDGSGSDPVAVEQLDMLAATFARDGADRSGVTRTRFLALATTVGEIADRLR